jgi:hypothetical protein
MLFWAPLLLATWWYLALPGLLVGLLWLAEPVMLTLFPHEILGLSSANERVWLVRTLLTPTENPAGFVAFQLPASRFSVSYPLFWALTLSAPGTWRLRLLKLLGGSVVLTVLILLMCVFYVQFQLALQINHQGLFGETPPTDYVLALPYSAWWFYLSGVGRQLAVLVLPTFAPVIVWGILNPTVFRSIVVEGLIQQQQPQAQP